MPATLVALGARKRGGDALLQLAQHLVAHDYQPVVDQITARNVGVRACKAVGIEMREPGRGRRPVLAVALGGDGSFIAHAARYAPFGVPLIGVNLGQVGFLADIPAKKMEKTIIAVLEGHHNDELRVMLTVEHLRADKVLNRFTVINDVVVDRGSSSIVALELAVNRNRSIHLRGDGVIFATPGGSTAYNMAAGGPIIMPNAGCIAMTPLNPFSLTQRPLVFSATNRFTVEVVGTTPARLLPDGIASDQLLPGDKVKIGAHRSMMTLRHPSTYNYFDTLREKLYWRYD